MGKFTAGMEAGSSFGSFYSRFTLGSETLNEPIKLHVIGMHEVFEDCYWTLMQDYVDGGYCTSKWDRAAAATNVLRAMHGYAEWKKIQNSTDPDVRIPLTWPDGKYGLTKPADGCPNTEFTWVEGQRYQDTENMDPSNDYTGEWDPPDNLPFIHFAGDADDRGRSHFKQHFCIKTVANVDDRSHWTWQPGSYCIFKYGDNCPTAFEEGYIYWDDEDSHNSNSASGTLPAGVYGDNTKYLFCCRSDGVTDHPIYLPTDDSFYLLSLFGKCQEVDGMRVHREWIYLDVEDRDPPTDVSPVHPFEGPIGWGKNIRITYCYYYRSVSMN